MRDRQYFCKVSSTIAWSSTRNTKSRTKLYVHIDWIWRYIIRLVISFGILRIDMSIFSCHVTRRSHDRSCEKQFFESRSFIILHYEHLYDIDDCFFFKSLMISHLQGLQFELYLSSSTHTYKMSYNMITFIDSPSFDTKLQYVCWSRSSLIQMFCSHNYHNRLNPRRVFLRIIMNTIDWFFVKKIDEILCTNVVFRVRATMYWFYQIAIVRHAFQSYSVFAILH